MIAIGIPAGLQSAAFSLSNVFLQYGVNYYGDNAIAGSTAVSTVEGLMWVTLTSFINATTTFTSQNVAAGKVDRARKSFRYALLLTASIGIFLGLGMFFCKKWILAIFITDNPIAVEFGYQRLKYTFPVYFMAGIMGVMPGAIRGHGSSLSPSLITIFGTCVIRVVWVFTVFEAYKSDAEIGLSILYLVHPITWVFTIAALSINYVIVLRRTIKKQRNAEPKIAESLG